MSEGGGWGKRSAGSSGDGGREVREAKSRRSSTEMVWGWRTGSGGVVEIFVRLPALLATVAYKFPGNSCWSWGLG